LVTLNEASATATAAAKQFTRLISPPLPFSSMPEDSSAPADFAMESEWKQEIADS
jgi:hypothetical protein